MPYCGSDCIVKGGPDLKKAVVLKCRSWLCPDCTTVRKRQLIAFAHRGRPDVFLTITHRRRPDTTPEQAAKDLAWAWRVMRKRAAREARRDINKDPTPFGAAPPNGWKRDAKNRVKRQVQIVGKELEFLAVVEKHQSGWPHLHILARAIWIDHAWISAQMLDLIDSPVVGIERLNTRSKAASYAAKYCGKATHKVGTAKRYWASRRYPLTTWQRRPPDDQIPGRWERQGFPINRWCAMWRGWGWVVEILDPSTAVARAPP